MKRWIMVVPLAVFLLVAVFLYKGLFLKPDELPSAMIGKPFPAFSLASTQGDRTLTQADLQGRPALVNVWATWCPSCKVEHPYLNQLAEQGVDTCLPSTTCATQMCCRLGIQADLHCHLGRVRLRPAALACHGAINPVLTVNLGGRAHLAQHVLGEGRRVTMDRRIILRFHIASPRYVWTARD